jgi:hypothetical protein
LTQKESQASAKVAEQIHQQLKKLDVPYSELESFTGLKPLAVTILPRGSFAAYKQYQIENGADLTNTKPPHLNPSDEMIEILKHPRAIGYAVENMARV